MILFLLSVFVLNVYSNTATLILKNLESTQKCTEYKYDLASMASNVTLCFIQFSQPLRMCEYCETQYKIFMSKYDQLQAMADNGRYCATQLLFSDILSIIRDVSQKFQNEYNEANCPNCYNNNTSALSDSFVSFLQQQDEMMTCLSNFTDADLQYRNVTFEADWKGKNFSSAACGTCHEPYMRVNSYYTKLEEKMDKENVLKLWRGLCGDMGEMMNMTRFLWSKKFGCTSATIEWYSALGPILTITAMSLIFYCVVSTYFHNRINMILYKQRRLRPIIEESG